jgi:hypothetical protein
MRIQINDKGGKHYRTYTEESLQMLFDVSPSAANFELAILIEGLLFLGYRFSCEIRKNPNEYDEFLSDKKHSSFYGVIERIYKLKIIDDVLKGKLHKYRQERNEIIHDLFRLKTINMTKKIAFKDFSYIEAQEKLFKNGILALQAIYKIVVPGATPWNQFLINLGGKEA